MGGTKIVVFQLKEIMKKLVYLCVGLAAIVFLILILMPKGGSEPERPAALYHPGTYFAEIILHNSPVRVAVTVTENEILSIDMLDMGETQAVFYPLFQPAMESISEEIVSTQNLDVTTATDTAYTGEILIKAIRCALEKAEAA